MLTFILSFVASLSALIFFFQIMPIVSSLRRKPADFADTVPSIYVPSLSVDVNGADIVSARSVPGQPVGFTQPVTPDSTLKTSRVGALGAAIGS